MPSSSPPTNRIELKLRDIKQLFNSLDPAPFHEKDLDSDAEEFIESSALELPAAEPIMLAIYVDELPSRPDSEEVIEEAVHHYFAYRSQIKGRELRHLLKRGRASLLIGLLFVGSCVMLGQLAARLRPEALAFAIQESLLIGGWVAMWRPLEIFLYDWWPIRQMQRLYLKMSRMEVEVRSRAS